MQVIIITVWLFAIMLFSIRMVNGWSFYFQARRAVWARRMAYVSRFEVEGIPRPECRGGKCKPPTAWFCEKQLVLTLFIIPFNLAGLHWYSKIGLGMETMSESESTLLILVLLVGWVIGYYVNGQSLDLEDSLRLSKRQYTIEASWLELPSPEAVSDEERSIE